MTYTDQEKTAIITQYRQGRPIQQLCTECGVCARTIYRWAKIYCPVVPDEKRTYTVKEYDALLRRVAKLENMVAILQTVGCTVHAEPSITIFSEISGAMLGSKNAERNIAD